MSASIRIESGISAGTSYWVDKPVLRVGSDPQCEICLPSAELAPHALTVEFRDGRYRAYNRGATPVAVGGATVPPGGLGELSAGQTMQLPGDLRLVLQIDGDPRPCPRPSDLRRDDEFDAEPQTASADAAGEEAAGKKSSKTLVQLAVIGFCVLGGAAFLAMPDFEPAAAVQEIPGFETLVEESLTLGDAAGDRLQRLQFAESALVRGHYPLAKARFSTLRNQLVRHRESLPEEKRTDVDRYLQYVEYQMSQF
ncbi:MAG: hypothetical protein WD851_07475 [Pirellulales bacterium]